MVHNRFLSLTVSFIESVTRKKLRQNTFKTISSFNDKNMGSFCSKNIHTIRSNSSMESNSDYVEGVVCKDSDVKENEMKTFDLDEGKVLLVRQKGELYALGSKCTHYGAPLDQAALGEGRIRCQWHGACFNLKTGDIEDFPGLDSLPCHKVSVENGDVIVRALKSHLQTNRRSQIPRKTCSLEQQKFVIVGGGPSGATCAEKLRQEGFNGYITLINKEDCLPYDRVKVSKALNIDVKTIQLRTPEFYKDLMVETRINTEVTDVSTNCKRLTLCTGETLDYDKLYLATGARARKLNMPGSDLRNVVTLRTYVDGNYVASQLTPESNVVILGASFIGMEAAAYLVDKCKSVTVVGKELVPFEIPFGYEIGKRVMELFQEKGCNFLMKNSVKECKGDDEKVTEVVLEDGTTVPADIFIMGVGVIYNTEFLKGSEVEMNENGSIPVNEYMETNIKDIYAGGDIAQAPVYVSDNEKFNIGHYGLSHFHGKIAALNMMGRETILQTVPFFWSMFFGKSIRYAGHGMYNEIKIFGDMAEMKFIAYFIKKEKVIAMATCQRDPVVAKFAEMLAQGKRLYLKDIEEANLPWCHES